GHRQAFPWSASGLHCGLAALTLTALWLRYLRSGTASSVSVLMTALALSAGGGLLLALGTHLSDRLPAAMVMAMPGRFLNVANLAFPALVLGLLCRHRWHATSWLLLGGVVAYIVL